MFVKRFFDLTDRYFFRRTLPHGIVCWRYLLPHPPPKVRLHRHLWILGRSPRIPFALFFLMEFFLWFRWVLFTGWRASWHAIRFRGETIRKQEGISRASQLMSILFISIGYCIPPSEIYAFGLYKSKSRHDIWNYIFTHELPAFHLWRNAKINGNRKSLSLLQDKYETSKLLAARRIPMAPLLAMVSRGESFDINNCLQSHPRLFCKPRHGSRSLDAYIIEARSAGEEAAVFTVVNGIQAQPSTAKQLHEAMTNDDFLIQQFLDNHPALATLTPVKDAVTLRVITQTDPLHGFVCYCATLEIPNRSDTSGCFHIILPIELSSGMLKHFPDQRFADSTQLHYDAFYQRIDGFIIPYWESIRKSALAAHQCFPDIYAIAWDYVTTAEGPYLLEGNTGWGTRTPQMLQGGLLQTAGPEE